MRKLDKEKQVTEETKEVNVFYMARWCKERFYADYISL